MCTGQSWAIAALIVVWIALVSSWVSSPTAPLQRTSIHGRPEHISTSPPRVEMPVVERVEKLPGDCACAEGANTQAPGARSSVRASARIYVMLITCPLFLPLVPDFAPLPLRLWGRRG